MPSFIVDVNPNSEKDLLHPVYRTTSLLSGEKVAIIEKCEDGIEMPINAKLADNISEETQLVFGSLEFWVYYWLRNLELETEYVTYDSLSMIPSMPDEYDPPTAARKGELISCRLSKRQMTRGLVKLFDKGLVFVATAPTHFWNQKRDVLYKEMSNDVLFTLSWAIDHADDEYFTAGRSYGQIYLSEGGEEILSTIPEYHDDVLHSQDIRPTDWSTIKSRIERKVPDFFTFVNNNDDKILVPELTDEEKEAIKEMAPEMDRDEFPDDDEYAAYMRMRKRRAQSIIAWRKDFERKNMIYRRKRNAWIIFSLLALSFVVAMIMISVWGG